MPHLDNPAGRLEALLVALIKDVNNDGNGAYIECWGRVLGLPAPEAVLELADVLRLIEQIRHDVASAGGSGYARLVARHIEFWKGVVAPMGAGLGASSNQVSMPSDQSLEDLAVVSDFLHDKLPDGKTPSAEELATPRQRLQESISAVLKVDEVPPAVKHLMIRRLDDVVRALDHLAVGGPRGVELAIEALIGALVLNTHSVPPEGDGRRGLRDVAKNALVVLGLVKVATQDANQLMAAGEDALKQLGIG